MPDLSVILVNYNEREFLATTLQKLIAEFSDSDIEILVVDNASSDGSVEMIQRQFPMVRCVATGKNLMYGKGNNEGLRVAKGAWMLLLNPDVDWKTGQLRTFVDLGKNHNGITAPRLLHRDGRIQQSIHRRFPSPLTVFVEYCLPVQQMVLRTSWHPHLFTAQEHQSTHAMAHATGVCLLFPRNVYDQIGGFDPLFTMYMEETDWEKRAADAGIERWFVSEAELTHFGSAKKTFAQASQHFLWGLHHYTKKHWSVFQRTSLKPLLWMSAVVSLVFLAAMLPFSLLLGKTPRVLHYLRSYTRLMRNLLHFPTEAPHVS